MSTILLCLLFLLLVVDSVCIDKPDQFDPSWIKIERTNPNNSIELLFALKQQNVNVLINTLLNVSNPLHSKYGQYLSNTDIHEMIKPSHSTINVIQQWLLSFDIEQHNINNKTINGDFLTALTTVETAQNILNCTYYNYYNIKIGTQYIISRLDTHCNYDIPSYISHHLDFISPTKRFPAIKNINHSNHSNYSRPYQIVTPPFIEQLYQINNTTAQSPLNKQGIASFLDEYFTDSDVSAFWNKYDITTDNLNLITRTSNSGVQPSGYGDIASINVEYMTSIGQNISTEIWYTNNTTDIDTITADPFLLFLLDILNSTNPPWLFIIAYSDYEFNLGYEYCSRCNTEFAKLGTMGITMLITSGDYGVGNDEQCCSQNPQIFCPMFPSSSPYITTIGGTTGGIIGKSPTGESAYHPSGGGFSNFFEMPQYQMSAVEDFISSSINQKVLPNKTLFNETGRAYPDISGQSYLCDYIIQDTNPYFSGTACGISIVGAIFSLLNDFRFVNNFTSLGFLNPFIYQVVNKDNLALNDVACGCPNNACMNVKGFVAIKGWDAVTGWGTPNYQKLKQNVLLNPSTGNR
eukprot:441808_1